LQIGWRAFLFRLGENYNLFGGGKMERLNGMVLVFVGFLGESLWCFWCRWWGVIFGQIWFCVLGWCL